MSESEQAKRMRVARKAAAFDLWLMNIPTAGHPNRGDPVLRERAEKVLDEEPPEGDGEDE